MDGTGLSSVPAHQDECVSLIICGNQIPRVQFRWIKEGIWLPILFAKINSTKERWNVIIVIGAFSIEIVDKFMDRVRILDGFREKGDEFTKRKTSGVFDRFTTRSTFRFLWRSREWKMRQNIAHFFRFTGPGLHSNRFWWWVQWTRHSRLLLWWCSCQYQGASPNGAQRRSENAIDGCEAFETPWEGLLWYIGMFCC